MKLKLKKEIKRILEAEMGLKPEESVYFIDALDIAKKNKINILELTLLGDIYPKLAKKYKIACKTVENRMVRALKNCWKRSNQERELMVKTLGCSKKPTVKKLLVLLDEIEV